MLRPLSMRSSPYYPPRARGPKAPRHGFRLMQSAIHLDHIPLPLLRSVTRTLAAILVPGLAFRLTGPRGAAKAVWIALGVCGLLFLAGLGTWVAEVAFGLIISAHVISVSHLLKPWIRSSRLALQIVFGLTLFTAFSLWFYMPARGWFLEHVAMPLRFEGRVVVVNPRTSTAAIQRGDVVAYRIPADTTGRIVIRAGMGLRPVWAMSGDVVVFGDGSLSLDGRVASLPESRREWGRLTVPEECWYIWPKVGIHSRGVGSGEVADALRALALVPHANLVGRPYGWWFFRAQGSQ